MQTRHREHDAEQRYIVEARVELERSIDAVESLLARAMADADNPHAQALAANLSRRAWRLRDTSRQAVCFARLDDEDDEVLYIGRQHIATEDHDELVIDWRALAAEPFYRATALNPMGCVRRRQFVLDGDTLVEIYDTDLADPHAGAGIPDPLLAEINRARTGSMRDIVSTIQHEQDAIVRAPLDLTLVVQGGPGTGKTAVGLHRAAYLLFEHSEILGQEGVLVVGPNRRFLEYIADVLPSLGERTFRQVVLDDLGDIDLPPSDQLPAVNRILAGDLRMVRLLRATLERIPVAPAEDVRVRTARETWISRVIGDMRSQVRSRSLDAPMATASEYAAAVRADPTFKRFVQEHWKQSKPEQAVRSMWRTVAQDRSMLERVGFSSDEIDALRARPARQKLTEVDRPLIDEATAQLGGRCFQYGHVILDEAQDLSPMALRMISRRARRGSLTVLGDVAQCAGDWVYGDWDVPLQALANERSPVEFAELTVGYRVPGEFIALANALLPAIAPGLTETTSVRPASLPPENRTVPAADLFDTTLKRVTELAQRWTTVAVIVQDDDTAEVLRALVPKGVDVLAPVAAKGLEFDAVVVLEPSDMTGPGTAGWRPLFVALTRAVQHLELIGTRPPPPEVAQLLP